MASSQLPPPANDAFKAYYLQRVTAELGEDLMQLRTAADFTAPPEATEAAAPVGERGAKKAAPIASSSRPGVTTTDNSLQMLIAALRQGADMFTPADQARVDGAEAADTGAERGA